MSMKNTSNDTSVKVINDATESDLLSIFRTLHHKTLLALTETSIAPLFNTEWDKCGSEDHKLLLQQTRALIVTKGKARKDARVAGVRLAIQGVVNTYMSQARAAKAAMESMPEDVRKFLPTFSNVVKIPLSDIRACFPKGESDTQVFADLEYLGYKVTDMTTNGKVIVPFVPVKAEVSEEAPKSDKQVKAA